MNTNNPEIEMQLRMRHYHQRRVAATHSCIEIYEIHISKMRYRWYLAKKWCISMIETKHIYAHIFVRKNILNRVLFKRIHCTKRTKKKLISATSQINIKCTKCSVAHFPPKISWSLQLLRMRTWFFLRMRTLYIILKGFSNPYKHTQKISTRSSTLIFLKLDSGFPHCLYFIYFVM
jgi:hypothetical protein